MATGNYTEERVQLAGTELYVPKGGAGSPVLVLHGFEGHEGWLDRGSHGCHVSAKPPPPRPRQSSWHQARARSTSNPQALFS